MQDQLGASQHVTGRDEAPKRANFDPAPARACPDFEQDAMILSLFPEASIERNQLLPGPRRDRWALWERLLLCTCSGRPGFVLLFAGPPFFERGGEGVSRAKRRIDGGAAKQGRDIWRDL